MPVGARFSINASSVSVHPDLSPDSDSQLKEFVLRPNAGSLSTGPNTFLAFLYAVSAVWVFSRSGQHRKALAWVSQALILVARAENKDDAGVQLNKQSVKEPLFDLYLLAALTLVKLESNSGSVIAAFLKSANDLLRRPAANWESGVEDWRHPQYLRVLQIWAANEGLYARENLWFHGASVNVAAAP